MARKALALFPACGHSEIGQKPYQIHLLQKTRTGNSAGPLEKTGQTSLSNGFLAQKRGNFPFFPHKESAFPTKKVSVSGTKKHDFRKTIE
ncbi:hypothetical protein J0A68_08835 [Algoriphagus sp. H41]|uniref:Uncharacterized protein n=1 Tax=Algoriphagus oliviformis TaxID=2811231 RepID=A0ABS3C638_9BACT|nr:hypothetical protein [Algoriphagus oliviformis]MBN7811059.1 hypothetical protein [Algoriphagus oliviformis]